MDIGRNEWIQARAQMIGKRALIGLTRVTPHGKVLRQMFGTIAAIDSAGVDIELEGKDAGRKVRLPPDLGRFRIAGPGDYLLWETGEILRTPISSAPFTVNEAA